MNRSQNLLTIYFVSGVMGLISEFLGAAQVAYIILLTLIIMDTLTGIAKSIKLKHFNSKGLQRFLKKVITYTTAIIAVRLLEIGILPIYETTMLSQIMAAYLIITETISILENITVLGVPIPSNFAGVLISYGTLDLEKIIQFGNDVGKCISEIDDIINYQIPSINSGHLRRLLKIKMDIWKRMVFQIDEGINEKVSSKEILYYKVMALVEIGFKEMEERWKDEIPGKHIEIFKSWHKCRVDNWLNKIQKICYSDSSWREKKSQIIESIVIILYQTIIDAQKGLVSNAKECGE